MPVIQDLHGADSAGSQQLLGQPDLQNKFWPTSTTQWDGLRNGILSSPKLFLSAIGVHVKQKQITNTASHVMVAGN